MARAGRRAGTMLAALVLAGAAAFAATPENWAPLSGDDLTVAVTGRHMRLMSDPAVTQQFNADGSFLSEWRELSGAPRSATGSWRAEFRQICTMVPPEAIWRCAGYERAQDGLSLRSNGPDGVQRWVYDDL